MGLVGGDSVVSTSMSACAISSPVRISKSAAGCDVGLCDAGNFTG